MYKFTIIRKEIALDSIVIVDDEKDIADLISLYIENAGYKPIVFYNSREAEKYLDNNIPSALILDIMMPEIDGLSVLKKLRENHNYPIILLTAKTGQADVLKGLYSGADDYIKKPFDPLELIARLNVHLRKVPKQISNEITYRNVSLNKAKHECKLNNIDLQLTPIEFKIMEILMEQVGSVVSSEEIFKKVWKEDYFEKDSNTVSVHIRNIRYKMNKISKNTDIIKTIWGVGYKIE